MQIHGFQKLTLLDYPEHIAATVFTGGCNFRCPFCQNGGLVLHPERQPLISEQEIFATLRKRRGVLQGVCITGGEPTLQKDLPEFLEKVKALGYLVKLDTNGYHPEILRHLIYSGLVDYVAMDVKASMENYSLASGVPGLMVKQVMRSMDELMSCGIEYEFRTTVVKGIHTVEEFEKIGKMLEGAKLYFLQSFRESEEMLGRCGALKMRAFSREEMEAAAELAGKYIQKVEIRGEYELKKKINR